MSATVIPIAPLRRVQSAETLRRGRKYRAGASNEISIEFEELPLLSEGGAVGGLVNGAATVAVHIDDNGRAEWFVHEIYLDGFRKREGGGFDRVPMQVEDGTPLYLTIWGELTDGSFKEYVARKVDEFAAGAMEPA